MQRRRSIHSSCPAHLAIALPAHLPNCPPTSLPTTPHLMLTLPCVSQRIGSGDLPSPQCTPDLHHHLHVPIAPKLRATAPPLHPPCGASRCESAQPTCRPRQRAAPEGALVGGWVGHSGFQSCTVQHAPTRSFGGSPCRTLTAAQCTDSRNCHFILMSTLPYCQGGDTYYLHKGVQVRAARCRGFDSCQSLGELGHTCTCCCRCWVLRVASLDRTAGSCQVLQLPNATAGTAPPTQPATEGTAGMPAIIS